MCAESSCIPKAGGYTDCGPCVNFLATMFARDPGTFHSKLKLKDTALEFPPSNEMRIDQAKEIFDFLMPEVMDP